MNDFLNEINNEIETGGAGNLYTSLQRLNQIETDILQDPLTNQQHVRKLFDNISENVDKNKTDLALSQQLQLKFNQWVSKLPPSIVKKYNSPISHIQRTFRRYRQQNEKQQIQARVQMNQMQQKFEENIRNQDLFKLQNPNPVVLQMTNNSTIEQSLSRYQSILSLPVPQQTTIQRAPSSIQFLSVYAKQLGYNPVGSISGSTGRCFIGTKQYGEGANSISLPFPSSQIKLPQVPDLPIKIQYYANKTINSWNNFIDHEAKMINFFNKITGSPDTRVKYIQQSLKYLNLQQFSAQTLATLSYYYVYLPMVRFAKFANITGSGQKQFYKSYPPAQKRSDNPLLLKAQASETLCKMLLGYDKDGKKKQKYLLPVELLKQIADYLKASKNDINDESFNTLGLYPKQRQSQANTYFKTSGIPEARFKQILGNNRFKVKTRRCIFVDQWTNNQLVQIIDKVAVEQKINTVQQDHWDLTWASKQIYAHDYIFRRQ